MLLLVLFFLLFLRGVGRSLEWVCFPFFFPERVPYSLLGKLLSSQLLGRVCRVLLVSRLSSLIIAFTSITVENRSRLARKQKSTLASFAILFLSHSPLAFFFASSRYFKSVCSLRFLLSEFVIFLSFFVFVCLHSSFSYAVSLPHYFRRSLIVFPLLLLPPSFVRLLRRIAILFW